jgi:hypothetical protein
MSGGLLFYVVATCGVEKLHREDTVRLLLALPSFIRPSTFAAAQLLRLVNVTSLLRIGYFSGHKPVEVDVRGTLQLSSLLLASLLFLARQRARVHSWAYKLLRTARYAPNDFPVGPSHLFSSLVYHTLAPSSGWPFRVRDRTVARPIVGKSS